MEETLGTTTAADTTTTPSNSNAMTTTVTTEALASTASAASAAAAAAAASAPAPATIATNEAISASFFESVVRLDPEVESAIAAIFPSDDPLDQADFDPVRYINTIFPSEQSLAGLDPFIAKLKQRIRKVDAEIQSSVRVQTTSKEEGARALANARSGMTDLFGRIRNIREKAEVSEQMVQEITRDIKSLDHAKRHLTTSITTLNHLHMLVGGVEQLESMTEACQYGDCAHLLGAVVNVLEHFDGYREIDKIRHISARVSDIQQRLALQITREFRRAFVGPEPDIDANLSQLREACAVLDVLEPSTKNDIKAWFIDLQLHQYRKLFHPSKEDAWVDRIDRRYSWIKRTLVAFVDNCDECFPPSWKMAMHVALRFCEMTRDDLAKLLMARREDLDVKLLLHAVQKTVTFEQRLASKFANAIAEDEYEEEEASDSEAAEMEEEVAASEADAIRANYLRQKRQRDRALRKEAAEKLGKRAIRRGPSKFERAISRCFEGVLDVYVSAQDTALEQLLAKFEKEHKSSLVFPEEDEGDGARVLPSAGEMFMFFRSTMMQCSQLSDKEPLFELYLVFKKYLALYARRLLVEALPRGGGLSALLAKEGDLRLSPEELYLVCSVLNTAEYCVEATRQMQEKLRSKVREEFVDRVDMTAEQDLFQEVVTLCIQSLVRALETACEPSLTAMTKMRWDVIEEVGDTSPFVSQIGKHVATMVPDVRAHLIAHRKFFTNFCLKFANSFIPRIISHMQKCKAVGTVGAEQLLLDIQSIRMLLTELPSIGAATARKPPASYMRFLLKGMNRAETIVKIVMAPHEPAKLFVEDYLKMVGDKDEDVSLTSFQRILDMKGLRKSEQSALVEAFHSLAPEASSSSSTTANRAHRGGGGDGRGARGAGAGSKGNTNLRKLEKLMKRFKD